ncbi:hypothetical protein A2X44_00115 [candidate division CPR3 bacterium GWF2_35_18]|uniref:Nuclease-like protein n=1 Tax=candidate division CPR3 bacterium GW2011_GWF2_35_18 TaxID=1618350 RepID=A0A0G0BKW1_UNCC3|nr:MAG: Nuclease-like protein [candidate division CPR3 bacterium GW2011_GWF2_35_18]KKP85628.1 MAG: Nuclease-like protein [candidate division CPR3 bacterium GW2011_GWE2_35_7]OGB63326.1 MAG: hypothetical protein A2X44_00115 [candidate division CPR3 bacterium GWF2_35_18]OGB65605.1 MAG: hypothetical protein A2250_02395 [candidate division CPR3 bacterium RIFOXYA2_FULL_35_13]OGB75569.1 MAG: hypothetical protein A2476_04385 [candidate division CPR3 bacterium RIFOXYC2_FULL_35_7]OGB79586.1 MAG: hypothe
MLQKVSRFFTQMFAFIFEVIIAAAYGRKPRFNKGGKQFFLFSIISLLLLIVFFNISAGNKNSNDTNSNTLKSYDFKNNESTSSATQDQNTVLVTRVIDGDTFEIYSGQKIRLIGINTPETVAPNKTVECYGQEASDFLKSLLENTRVSLVKDVSETDSYGRLLRYVYLDNLFVNEYLVKEGYAEVSTYPPDVKYQEVLEQAEETARTQEIGLWGNICSTDSEQTVIDSNECTIKGNISWAGEKIYHLITCKDYDQTVIDEKRGEKYFCTEEDAINAGFKKAANCN